MTENAEKSPLALWPVSALNQTETTAAATGEISPSPDIATDHHEAVAIADRLMKTVGDTANVQPRAVLESA